MTNYFTKILGLICVAGFGYAAEASERAFESVKLQKAEILNTLTTPITFDILSTYRHLKTEGDNLCEPSLGYVFDIEGKAVEKLQVKNFKSNIEEILQKQTLTLAPNDRIALKIPSPHYLKGLKCDVHFVWNVINDHIDIKLLMEDIPRYDGTPVDQPIMAERNTTPLEQRRIFSWSFQKNWLEDEYGLTDHNNIGEFLFYAGAQNLLKKYQLSNFDELKSGDIYLIVVSNILNPISENWSSWVLSEVDIASKKGVEIIVLCCGAQSEISNELVSVNPTTVSLFQKIYSLNPKSIGVRGLYSQYVLKQYGIQTTILGCPSIMHMWHNLDRLKFFSVPDKVRLAYAGTPGSFFGHQLIHHLGYKFKGKYIAQSVYEANLPNNDEVDSCLKSVKTWNEDSFLYFKEEHQNESYIKLLNSHGVLSIPPFEEIENHLKENIFFPRSYKGWIDYLTNFDLFIGSRIHGTIAALLAGCRALCIAHDSRTLELCETLSIPYVTEFSIPNTLHDFYEKANPKIFLESLEQNQQRFRDFLSKNSF